MNVLGAIEQLWLAQIERAKQVKKTQFDETAERIWRYYGDGTHKFLFDEKQLDAGGGIAPPRFPITVNMTAEFVRMMLPYLHNRAPARVVSPRTPPMPMELAGLVPPNPNEPADVVRSHLMQWLLNYTPDLFDLRSLGRSSVTESLVKGRGVMWHEMDRGFCGSFPDSVDHLLLDPDSESLRNCAFAVRVRNRPAWAIAEDFRLDAAKLKGAYDSQQNAARRDSLPADIKDGVSGDVLTYYEVYSRMGVGSKYLGASEELRRLGPILESVGPQVYLAILPGFGLLNLP